MWQWIKSTWMLSVGVLLGGLAGTFVFVRAGKSPVGLAWATLVLLVIVAIAGSLFWRSSRPKGRATEKPAVDRADAVAIAVLFGLIAFPFDWLTENSVSGGLLKVHNPFSLETPRFLALVGPLFLVMFAMLRVLRSWLTRLHTREQEAADRIPG